MQSKWKSLSRFLWGIVIIGMMSSIFFSPEFFEYSSSIQPKVSSSTLVHPKIVINGDAELLSFPNKTGSGTENEPFVISDISIDAGGNGSCIEINDTSYFLHLYNITVSNAGPDGGWEASDFDAGIELRNCTNIQISRCISEDSHWGIVIRECTDCVITNNLILQNEMVGIFVDEITQSANLIFQQNEFEENFIGMWMRGGCEFSMIENEFSSSKYGPLLEILQVYNSTFQLNEFDSEIHGECFDVFDSHNNLIQFNTFKNSLSSLGAMYVWNSNDNVISNNLFASNQLSMWLQVSHRNEISKNTFQDGDTGISLDASSYNSIVKNQFKRIETNYVEIACLGNVFVKYINWWAIIIGSVAGIGVIMGGFFVAKVYKKRRKTPEEKLDQDKVDFQCPNCGEMTKSTDVRYCLNCGAKLK